MANNRLYLINTETLEYIGIAKSFGVGWQLKSVDLLASFLSDTYDERATSLLLVAENSPEWDEWYPKLTRIDDPEPAPNYYEPTDAALIAAAPEMLDVLMLLKYWHDKNDPIHTSHFYLQQIMERANNVIAKAEGNIPTQTETK